MTVTPEVRRLNTMFKQIANSFGFQEIPKKYLVLDCETSGVDRTRDIIIQVGFCAVEDGKSQNMGAFLVKRPPGAVRNWEMTTKITRITQADLDAAEPPEKVFPMFMNLIQTWLDNGHLLVGHNFIQFDLPFFNREFAAIKEPRRIPAEKCLDTGMMVKASRINMQMKQGESFRSFASRVNGIRRRGLLWSLDKYCFDEYELSKLGVDRDEAHDAGYDCFMTHLVLEAMRKRYEESKRG